MNPLLATVAKKVGGCTPLVLIPLLLDAAPSSTALAGGGGWVEGWGAGAVVSAVQPGTSTPCISSQPCEITASGSGEVKSSFGAGPEIGQFDLQIDLTIDLAHGTPNGFGQRCFPASGALSLRRTKTNPRFGTLVVDLQGQECALGSSATLAALAATYVVSGADSTGKYAGAAGIGTVSGSVDTSRSPTRTDFAFSGSLLGATK